MEIIPTLIDGAVVCNIESNCKSQCSQCETGGNVAIMLHNWLKATKLNYLIADFQDEKYFCADFLEGIVAIRKRLRFPFLFSGMMEQPRSYLQRYNYGESYPLFVIPEDAIRALRMQHPGVTEIAPEIPIHFDHPLSQSFIEIFEQTYEAQPVYKSMQNF